MSHRLTTLVLLLYLTGSACFAVGTTISLVVHLRSR